jgi:hypothetical protein
VGLDSKVELTNANQEMMPKYHNIWVQYTQSEDNDLDNSFQDGVLSIPKLHFSCTPPNLILQFKECLPAGKTLLILSERCETTHQGV